MTDSTRLSNGSPVSWPSHWHSAPLWSMFERVKDVNHPDEDLLSVYRDHGVVRREARADNFNKAALDRNIYQLVHPGWFVVNRMKAWQGSVGISLFRGIVSGHYICFRPTHHEHDRFLNWLLRSGPYTAEYASLSRGVRPNQVEIDNEWLRSLRIVLPPLEEQRRIADFLDAETARIDRLASLYSQLTSLLTEREHAVRDSIVEKLHSNYGTIPLRRLITRIDQGSSPQCEAIPRQVEADWGVLRLSAVKQGRFEASENKRLPDHELPDKSYALKRGDFLVTRANTPNLVGDVAVVNEDPHHLLLPDLIYRVRPSDGVSADFLAQVALGRRVRSFIASVARGSSQSMVKLRGEDIRDWPIPHVPEDQQSKLVREVAQQTDSSARLQGTVKRQLTLLAERRQALITAAVTGQFDVTTANGRNVTEGVSP
ncbi:restriction endonuclease subunit S [Streptomyces anthocyanicus]|uniref:restriction endonuclease subunit S n=1 Tax=Streptomyces anthocyanicus TaxID=68174 RepID=UPI0038505C3E